MKVLTPEQAHDLIQMAEKARESLSDFAGHEIEYEANALHFLDEWVDRYLQQQPNPSQKIRLLWATFLGEMFRRHHQGWWVLQETGLAILCPLGNGDRHVVDVIGQVDLRIEHGMAESLAYFYNVTRINLKMGQQLIL